MRAVLGCVLAGVVASGCATVVRGSTQAVRIDTTPPGATATAAGRSTVTPGTLDLPRDRPSDVEIAKPGYVTARRCVAPRMDGAVYGNLALGGVIGMLVDQATGAVYALDPETVDVRLVPEDPDATPR